MRYHSFNDHYLLLGDSLLLAEFPEGGGEGGVDTGGRLGPLLAEPQTGSDVHILALQQLGSPRAGGRLGESV